MSFAVFFSIEKTVDVFGSVIVWQSDKVVAVHCHCHILNRIVEQHCAVFVSSEASSLSTDQGQIIKLPDVGIVLSSVHVLDQAAIFGFAILLTILFGKSEVTESLGCSFEMCSADVVVSQLQWFPSSRHIHRPL